MNRYKLLLFMISVVEWGVAVTDSCVFAAEPYRLQAQVQSQFLGVPFYRNLNTLEVSVSRAENAVAPITRADIVLSARDQSGQALVETRRSLSVDEIQNCFNINNFSCTLQNLELPLTVERKTCEVILHLESTGHAVLTAPLNVIWGQCENETAPIPPYDVRSDLAWHSQITTTQVAHNGGPFYREPERFLQAHLENQSNITVNQPLKTMVLGFDDANHIIWLSQTEVTNPIPRQGQVVVAFNTTMFPWQWHRLCRVRFLADTDFTLNESSKANNDVSIPLGLCEPSSQLVHQRADLVVWAEKTETDRLTLHILNLGQAPVFGSRIPLTYEFDLLDAHETILFQMPSAIETNLYGYGDEAIITWGPFPQISSSCHIRVRLNQEWRHIESNYSNNEFDLNQCSVREAQ